METKEIRVKVNGGYLIAKENSDPYYPGIYIEYETNDGDILDVVVTEVPCDKDDEDTKNNKDINVYTYEDVMTDDWTRKFTLKNSEIIAAFQE